MLLPDATIALDYALDRMARVVETLLVYPERMAENLDRTYGLVFSQRLLLGLVDAGLSREAAYDTVQPLAMQAWRERTAFRALAEASPEITARLSAARIADAFAPDAQLGHVGAIFERVGLE